MDTRAYLSELNSHLSHLYSFARQINELDFAASLSGEFRGMQDAGWATTITAHEVFNELCALAENKQPRSKADLRILLMLYCQLSEAGGVYETIKNMMGVITLKPYLLWPFQDLVRVRKAPNRVIGPNANATFRYLAATARAIGMARLSSLLEFAFRDDIRNGIYHADYVIWDDGLRLRRRNGGNVDRLSFDEVSEALTKGLGFFQILTEHTLVAINSFNPPKEIVGRFSANPPMPWTVFCDPETRSFRISSSSPGAVMTPEYQRQLEINSRLGGRVLATYTAEPSLLAQQIEAHIEAAGFEPINVVMKESELAALANDLERLGLWDTRKTQEDRSDVMIASPWGFRYLRSPADFDGILEKPLVDLCFP